MVSLRHQVLLLVEIHRYWVQDLTSKAFTRSLFGEFGQYIVAIGLLLFAFSTAIAWSYYGDRATVHLFGEGFFITE